MYLADAVTRAILSASVGVNTGSCACKVISISIIHICNGMYLVAKLVLDSEFFEWQHLSLPQDY